MTEQKWLTPSDLTKREPIGDFSGILPGAGFEGESLHDLLLGAGLAVIGTSTGSLRVRF